MEFKYMSRGFVQTSLFEKRWKSMGLGDDELRALEDVLLENPQEGDVIQGGNGARKLRIELGSHGKRGGARVIYVDILKRERIYLLYAYAKNEQGDLTSEQQKAVAQLVDFIKNNA